LLEFVIGIEISENYFVHGTAVIGFILIKKYWTKAFWTKK